MKSPWKTLRPLDRDQDYLVLVSSIPPKSIRSTWKLFQGARAVRQQLAFADGVMGFSLLAEPFSKRYATLSVWVNEAALDSFATSLSHGQLMATLTPEMAETRFVRWTISGAAGLPSWDEAIERLA